MGYKDPQQQKEYQQKHYQSNKHLVLQRQQVRRKKVEENAIQSLYTGCILNTSLWSSWFKNKTYKNTRFVYNLSEIDAFELLIKKCFYCGSFATTLDRLDSNLNHTKNNCVGCCEFCNNSKQAQDPKTFILQAVYRRLFICYDDDIIWDDNTSKPRLRGYKEKALKQGKIFELSETDFDAYTINRCHYCRRFPPKGSFFGIDKMFPDDGYVIGNCITACVSCNRAKWNAAPADFTLRDERITQRYLIGVFDDLPNISKNISHQKNK
ncbi:hypothetical protein PBCVCan184_418R [Paramecium bursaria Chlorella virus Can18-4]|nr:hypothetical protein PBCVCan184_418R [Paramecium bursaria Chlorella virus Can18-4]